jgi:hypothetical protein
MTAGIVPANKTSSRLEKFFEKIDPVRGRLVFALDATASRQPSWDLSASLTGEMFNAVAAIGGLDVQLIYYRGLSEIFASRWFSDARSLATIMSTIQCRSGHTKIGSVLRHIRRENAHEKVNAAIIISDACEEIPADLYVEARELTVPTFLFQEGTDERVAAIYAEIAKITGGAHCRFDAGAASRLAQLLQAVALYATGGVKALAAQKSEAAQLLLAQVRK